MESQSRVTVQVQLHGYLRTGTAEFPLTLRVSPSLDEALQQICQQVPGLDEKLKKGNVVILLNNVNLHQMRDTSVTLADGDVIAFVPFVAGGRGIPCTILPSRRALGKSTINRGGWVGRVCYPPFCGR